MINISFTPIGILHSDFPEKFGIPRQSSLAASLTSTISFYSEYRNPDMFKGLEEFSHIWLFWLFTDTYNKNWHPTVRPPRLGGNVRKGVFATRSPFRPNPIGLSSVKLESIIFDNNKGPIITVNGCDIKDNTPILDIKPYILSDCHPEANSSYAEDALEHKLNIHCQDSAIKTLPISKQNALFEVLSLDPRPGYQKDIHRIYTMDFDKWSIDFQVNKNNLFIKKITLLKKD